MRKVYLNRAFVKGKIRNKISHCVRNDRREMDPGSGSGMTGGTGSPRVKYGMTEWEGGGKSPRPPLQRG